MEDEFSNEQMMAILATLPEPDAMEAGKITDPLGSDCFYSARTVAKIIFNTRKRYALDIEDAKRMRWILDGNGYFMEEEMLCGHSPCSEEDQDKARRIIDIAIANGR